MVKGRGRGRGRGKNTGDNTKDGNPQRPGSHHQTQEQPSQEQKQPPQEQKQPSQEQKQPPQEQKQPPQEQKQPPQEQKQPAQEQKQPPQQQKPPAQDQKQLLQTQNQPAQRQLASAQKQHVQDEKHSPQKTPIDQKQLVKSPNSKTGQSPSNTLMKIRSTCGKTKFPGYQVPKRPGFGVQGRKIKLWANFFPLKIPDVDIHQYDVTINEDKLPKRVNRDVMETFIKSSAKVFKSLPVYDGKKSLFTKDPLAFTGKRDFEVMFEERNFKITLKWAAQVNLKVLEESLKNPNSEIPKDAIQSLDVVLRQTPSLAYIPLGSKFFGSDGAVNIGQGLAVWHGYHMSIRPSQWKMLVNVDVSATAFYRTIPVIEFLYEITRYDCTKERRPPNLRERLQFNKEIKGLRIEITYMGKQRRKYRVNSITERGANEQTFPFDQQGKTISMKVQDYFRDEKKVILKFPSLPCLHVGDKSKNVYLPMEVCNLVPAQRCMKRLNENAIQQMIKIAARKPHERKSKIAEIVRNANFGEDKYLKSFGLEVDNRMVEVEGRILPTPDILYNQSQPLKPANGAWNMVGRKVFKGAVIKEWAYLVYNIGRAPRDEELQRFEDALIKTANGMGITMSAPLYRQRVPEYKTPNVMISDMLKRNENIELAVVVLPGKTPIYGDLKRLGDTENGCFGISDPAVKKIVKDRGLSTQCIQSKNVLKCSPMTVAQLCLKINTKRGGINNSIDSTNPVTRPKRIFSEPVIFLGADVTHPGIGDKSSPSIAAIVGSVDAIPCRYAVCVRVQKHRMEVIEDLENVTKDLLIQFYRHVGMKPMKIVMFRDGVSEGQFLQVLLSELSAIQRACTRLEAGYQPGITFVVVQKRHKATFYAQNINDKDRSGNVMAGTTIDRGVCHPTQFDYYQYSHAGIQGTSRPAHYHVLWDDNNLTADELQALSFMLCHLYVRCTRSVSIPAPAYYAHHVAFRARYHLQNEESSISSACSDAGEKAEKMRLSFKEIVKPHPKMATMMYFV